MEKNIIYNKSFSFLSQKTKPIKQKKIIDIRYLIVVPIKMRLLIFLVLSQYGSVRKYEIISQIWIYNWTQNWIFWYFWDFHIFKIKLQLKGCLNLLRQVRCFITWWVEISIITSDYTASSGKQLRLKKKDESR